MNGGFGTIIQIGDILVSEDVVLDWFACDYAVCRGACCIEGESGAPLEENELEYLEREYPVYSELMDDAGKAAVAEKGFFEIDRDGDLVTPLSKSGPQCAFAMFCDGNCLCTIERKGLKKPVSCSLYPIRVTKLTGGGLALNVHHWDICKPAFELGRKTGTRVYQFLKTPLIDTFGPDFYEALDAAAAKLAEEGSD